MDLDPKRYPYIAAYLERLPHGIESYPECQIKADVHEDISAEFPELASGGGLPKIVDDYLNRRYRETWLPEVVGNSLILLVRDACFGNDDEFLEWCRINMGRLFSKPLYKIMMNVFSTSLVVMGAAKRWSTFHLGSHLTAKPIKKVGDRFETAGSLTYPPYLFSGLIVPQVAATYKAALQANKANDPQISSAEKSDTESVFYVSWRV